MKNIHEIIEQLGLETNLSLNEIPKIDLYMDQVIQLFENKFAETKRNEDEKVLTKTMINNYAKGKLIFPIKNKKYSREHLMLVSLIYQLKGALSINDINHLLSGINKQIVKEEIELDSFYENYLKLASKNAEVFRTHLDERVEEIKADSDYLEQVLMIASFAHMSNMYRRAAERLIDKLPVEKEGKRQK